MKKIKYQGGITKLLMSRRGKINKKKFADLSNNELSALIQRFENQKVPMSVVSLSSSHDFNEQLLSILSYQRFMGVPLSWTVYSDGSHTEQEITDLESIFPFVKVVKVDFNDPAIIRANMKERFLPYFDELLHYTQNSPYGKKLYYYINHEVQNPTLFIDSDIMFYELASESFKKIRGENENGWFLPDQLWYCLDSRYKSKHDTQMYQINSGFFLMNKELNNVEAGLDFLKSLEKQYEPFTEQTFFHLLLRENKFIPFDPRIFILNSGDQFDFSYKYSKNAMAIRHYTGPVRHKMWQRDWKWHLSLDSL